jgi:hypothetical protein
MPSRIAINQISLRALCTLVAAAAVVVAGVLLLMMVLGLGSRSAGAATAAAASTSGEFTPIHAVRLLDTVHGVGAPKAKLRPGKTITVQITGKGGIPAGTTAVTTTVTATSGTASSHLVAYPTGAARTAATTLYFGARQTVATNATVGLSASGKLSVYNAAGTVNVDVDIQGYYAPSAEVAELQSQVSTLSGQLTALKTKQASDEASVAALTSLLSGVSRVTLDSQPTLRFSGMNIQIVDGAGTQSAVNGKGNLIVGYDDNTFSLPRTGSHNIITGDDNGWTSDGGLISGEANEVDGPESAITGGTLNTANGRHTSITGGRGNIAHGENSALIGGFGNTANGVESSINGGISNVAAGGRSAISGGYLATTTGPISSISGGYGNTASGQYAVVNGGYFGTASGSYSASTGGYGNVASGPYSTVDGGYINEANGYIASILGGESNKSPAKCSSIPATPINGTCS